MDALEARYRPLVDALARPVAGAPARLVAVSKTQPAEAVRALAALGQRAFGENYVQEALAKQRELADLALEWHLIGPISSEPRPATRPPEPERISSSLAATLANRSPSWLPPYCSG